MYDEIKYEFCEVACLLCSFNISLSIKCFAVWYMANHSVLFLLTSGNILFHPIKISKFPFWPYSMEFIRTFRFSQRCFPESHCRPNAAKLERVSTIQGVRVIEVTEACECTPDSSCRRESFTHLVHSGTPHQAVMDVGVCMGHCAKGI